MTEFVKVTVRLSRETHRSVKMRAVQDGIAMETLGRGWFKAYAEGRLTEWSPGLVGDLAAGDEGAWAASRREGSSGFESQSASGPAASSPAARPCSQAFKHHINHSGRPCKECGYPVKEAEKT